MSDIGLKTLVLITGAISAVVWLMPGLVTLGLFLLIIPGLILMIMPTVFLYLLAALAIRSVLPIGGMGGTALALAIAVALGYLIPQPFRMAQAARYHKAMLPEVVPASQLALGGEVLIVTRTRKEYRNQPLRCEALCAALLAHSGVTGVSLRIESLEDGKVHEGRFHLDPARTGAPGGLAPIDPARIVDHLPDKPGPRPPGSWSAETDPGTLLRRAVVSDWALRLATVGGLVEGAAAPRADWTITITDRVGGGTDPLIHRLEIADPDGALVLRRSRVTQRQLAAPFHFGFAGSIENARFEVAHTALSNAPSYPEFNPLRELLTHTSLATALPDLGQSGTLRKAVVAALDNPAASPEQLGLASGWMDSLSYTPAKDDLALVNRIIADQRITGIRKQVNRFYSKKAPPELREALVQRIVNPASDEDERRAYAQLLSKLPEGAFAQFSPVERQILNDPALRRQAAPLIERLADLGQPGLAALMKVLEAEIASNRQWALQRPVIRAVRRGLARLGPAAAPALPRIEQLFAMQRNPLANVHQEAVEWRVCMARMGKPVDDLPFPSHSRPELLERDKAQIRKRLEEFDPAWESGYSY